MDWVHWQFYKSNRICYTLSQSSIWVRNQNIMIAPFIPFHLITCNWPSLRFVSNGVLSSLACRRDPGNGTPIESQCWLFCWFVSFFKYELFSISRLKQFHSRHSPAVFSLIFISSQRMKSFHSDVLQKPILRFSTICISYVLCTFNSFCSELYSFLREYSYGE